MVQIFYLHPYLGKISNFDYIIFFNWAVKNHQLVGDDGGSTTAFASGKGCATESTKVHHPRKVVDVLIMIC